MRRANECRHMDLRVFGVDVVECGRIRTVG